MGPSAKAHLSRPVILKCGPSVEGQNLDPTSDVLNQKLWGQGPSDMRFLTPGDSSTCSSLRITYFDIHLKKNAINHRFY